MKLLEYEIFDEWISLRSRIGRNKKRRIKDLVRSTAAKRAWKLYGAKLKGATARWHKSPPGMRFHRSLNRFNTEKSKAEDYELLAPLIIASLAEHMSWLIYQPEYSLHEEVYDIVEILGYISEDNDIIEDILAICAEDDKINIEEDEE